MIREEEDDMTQEIRALAMAEFQAKVDKFIKKIEGERPDVVDEFTEGVTAGLNWAVRILQGDKSAG